MAAGHARPLTRPSSIKTTEDARSVPAGFLFHGVLPTYEKLGFVRDRKIGKHRWVVTKVIEPHS